MTLVLLWAVLKADISLFDIGVNVPGSFEVAFCASDIIFWKTEILVDAVSIFVWYFALIVGRIFRILS